MGGLASDVMQFGTPQTGFLGAIVGGVLAGVIAHWIAQRKVPSWARGLMPVLVIPLFTTIVAGVLMLVVFGKPIAWLMARLTDGLNNMSGANAVLLGIILGLMMAFDMGGPLNKVAYSFAAAGVGGAAALASDVMQFGTPQTGFIGAIVGGVLAGLIAHWIAQRTVPSWARGLMPVLVIPMLTSVIAGILMIVVLGKPIGWLMDQLNNGLTSMSGSSAVLLGIILGLMMAFDMGGPLNKVAYSFAAAGVGGAAALSSDAPELKIMAAVMLAGMVPPIALALATVVRPKLFTPAERENGKAAWLLGASFITEGAIPFAAADPLRVIPSIMLGSAVTGGLSMAFDVSVRAPHGGIFVLFAVGNILGYLVALAAGVVVGAAAVVTLKSLTESEEEIDELATVPV